MADTIKMLQSAVIVFAATLLTITNSNTTPNSCVLPQFPRNGYYSIPGRPNVHPGMAFDNVHLRYICRTGFTLQGPTSTGCYNGLWNQTEQAKCLSQCVLNKNPSVQYLCMIKNSNSWRESKECDELVNEGTTVRPICRTPFYYSKDVFADMQCADGVWNYVATCTPECGVVQPKMSFYIATRPANYGNTPWHVGIFYKLRNPFQQVCGGSIISSDIVISAAHCFWREKTKHRPPSEFAVAAGKLYRHWDNPLDDFVQKSDVQEIRLPTKFSGINTSYREDIAILIVTTQFYFGDYVRPVCIDFDYNFDSKQLTSGNIGKIASWGRSANDGIQEYWQFLQEVNLPYVDVERCLIESSDMRAFITVDKFCAYYNDTARELCQGDTGGGLAFPAQSRGRERYFLRGVASTARGDKQYCVMFTTFTQVLRHEQFIKQYYTMPQKERCILPPYPDHGSYTTSDSSGRPGDAYDHLSIIITCQRGYEMDAPSSVQCYNGQWLGQTPKCVLTDTISAGDDAEQTDMEHSVSQRNPCEPSPCGPHSQCKYINDEAVCSCLPNYIGSPPSCRPQCTKNTDCSEKEACINLKCKDPCWGSCGVQALCLAKNHLPVCSCPAGLTGNPVVGCTRVLQFNKQTSACEDLSCGPHSTCYTFTTGGVCSCLQGFKGAPPHCTPACKVDDDCSAATSCVKQICVDPCLDNPCGDGTNCRVESRKRVCSCWYGFTGNPLEKCTNMQTQTTPRPSQESDQCNAALCGPNAECTDDMCTCIKGYSRKTSYELCTLHVKECSDTVECPSNLMCLENSCENPCDSNYNCGENAKCNVVNHAPTCSCLSGFSGSPYEKCRSIDSDKKYQDPCVSSPCGENSICRSKDGKAACECFAGYKGLPPNCS